MENYPIESVEEAINDFIEIEEQISALYGLKNELIKSCIAIFGTDKPLIKQNDDGTWTRVKITDNLQSINEGFYKAVRIERYSSKVETLKRMPKELKESLEVA